MNNFQFIFTKVIQVTTRLSRAVTTPLIKAPEESEIKEKNSGKGDTLSILKAKIDELEDNNLALLTRLRQSDDEKNNLLSSQKNQIAQLISEFDNLKNELDQVNISEIFFFSDKLWKILSIVDIDISP